MKGIKRFAGDVATGYVFIVLGYALEPHTWLIWISFKVGGKCCSISNKEFGKLEKYLRRAARNGW
jgi:hypothetical protein